MMVLDIKNEQGEIYDLFAFNDDDQFLKVEKNHAGKDVVFIEQDGNFLPIEVDILITQDGLVAITSKKMSLLKRSQIVCKGAYELLALRNKEVE